MKVRKRIGCSMIVGLLILVFLLGDEMECNAKPSKPSDAATLIGMKDADGYDRQEGWFNDWDFKNSLALLIRQYPTSQKTYVSNCSAGSGIEYLKKSCIFMIRSHGSKTSVKFTDDNGNVTHITTTTLNNLANYDLINAQLVVYGTCSTGEGGAKAVNIVNSTYDKYARHVVGFKDTIYTPYANDFFRQFMHELGTEKETLGDAYEDALFWVKVWHLGDAGGIDKVLIRGNENDHLAEYKVYSGSYK